MYMYYSDIIFTYAIHMMNTEYVLHTYNKYTQYTNGTDIPIGALQLALQHGVVLTLLYRGYQLLTVSTATRLALLMQRQLPNLQA